MSSAFPFRQHTPKRTVGVAIQTEYRKYKAQLAADFQSRCGYTDCPHFWFGGMHSFHIDHRKPKSKYKHLECDYGNLVYSCSYVNQAKSDDDADYLDPCDSDYNLHFGRNDNGEIVPLPGSQQADYMYTKLKLYLKRYGIIWTLENLRIKLAELRALLDTQIHDPAQRTEMLEKHFKLSSMFEDYLKYLSVNQ